ncbi:MAG: N-acetyl-gamma-glutamyl-phosphate reductase [Coriobacteriia bacterium]|nr:N-acetyl-gamma-glutamyl-phosphate reductase [Coriobacteriia bacterium]
MTIKAGVVGAAGFAGIEVVRLLLNHPDFELVAATSDAQAGVPLASMYPAFAGATHLAFTANAEANLQDCQVVFTAVPHTAAIAVAPGLIKQGVTVIDLSADFRFDDPAVYEKWYKVEHTEKDLLSQRSFGQPELFREGLQAAAARYAAGEAVLVGCAGCYVTATSLAAAPAIRGGFANPEGVVVADAISGVTGAGKKCTETTHFCFANESLKAYGVASHRHSPEIGQILGLDEAHLVFTPHLAPLNRGLLSTVNIPLDPAKPTPTQLEITQAYASFYANDPCVTVLPTTQANTASVAGTNQAHVSAVVHTAANMVIATCAIDNLGKGAAGQAVQCANIVCGLEETAGLGLISPAV